MDSAKAELGFPDLPRFPLSFLRRTSASSADYLKAVNSAKNFLRVQLSQVNIRCFAFFGLAGCNGFCGYMGDGSDVVGRPGSRRSAWVC